MSLLLVKVRRALRSSSSSVAENILAAHIHEVRDPIPGLIYSSRKPEDYAWLIISLAMYQYPIHLYMTIALGAANESLLSGDSENAWGFGQIVALILCATTLLECVKGIFATPAEDEVFDGDDSDEGGRPVTDKGDKVLEVDEEIALGSEGGRDDDDGDDNGESVSRDLNKTRDKSLEVECDGVHCTACVAQ
ncbi:hypothetical protein HG530_011054 [Fusarium avenaceum]|nr:hypothetical protein HG530_011054 [Fusarium avenaceum]